MNIEELNKEYKNKMDKLLEEYEAKVKEVKKKEEPFMEKGQEYFCIDSTGFVCSNIYSNNLIHQRRLNIGNCFPYTEENKEEVEKEVKLIAERRKLQSQMEMFARQNNEEEIDWNNIKQQKWYLYIYYSYSKCEIRINWHIADEIPNAINFTSKKIAEKALDKFGDRIRELYINVENDNN